ncbi:MAG: hypothetical protein ACR2N0_18320 [Rubrobacteraceae bacterium]
MDRQITEQERTWLLRSLKTLEAGEGFPDGEIVYAAPYLTQLGELRVVGECECGEPNCHTIKFQHFGEGASVAFVDHHTEDGRMLTIFEDEAGMLSELEVI